MFENEIETAKDIVVDITPVTVVETPLFNIHFKNYEFCESKLDPTKGFTALNVFSICDKLIIQIASDAITGRTIVFGEDAVANNTTPNFLTVFNEKGNLLEEWRVTLKDSDAKRVEQLYTAIKAHHETVQALIVAHSKMFPLSRTGLQLAWDSETTSGIYKLPEALAYRIRTNSKLRDIKKKVEARKHQRETIDALQYAKFSDVLGF
jgi:hypothetical protein